MKRFRIAGLCLVAVFAFGAVAAASASASQPHFMACEKVAKTADNYEKVKAGKGVEGERGYKAEVRTPEYKERDEGVYSGKLCGPSELAASPGAWDGQTETATEAPSATSGIYGIEYKGPEGKYELTEAPEIAVTGKSKTTTITTKGVDGNEQVVVCKKGAITGERSEDEILDATVSFEKCDNADREACETGSLGKIVTESALTEGDLYYINEEKTDFGLEWYLPLDFTCGTEKVEVAGFLLGTAVNTSKGVTVTFNVSDGHQEDRTIWGEEEGAPVAYTEQNNLFSKPGKWNTTEATLAGTEEIAMKGVVIHGS